MKRCPPEATLHLIGTEAVGAATFAALEEHVEGCVDCQRVLEAATRAGPPAMSSGPAHGTPPVFPGLVIERVLGRGATSVVYLVREPALERHVAVKLFPRNSLIDPHTRAHWLAEARALSRVPHDHVVAIHRVEETEDWLCLVLEYVPGGTLKDRLTEPLPPRDAARLTEIIARTVGYFHARGVSHLDLKPSNILLDGDPGAPWDRVSPKISDFGIARLEGEPGATETGANGPKGTPSYMAPEQVAALPGTIGPAADIHALGALLYHLLTGRPPFQGASTTETLDQVRNQDPVPPRRLSGRIPRDLETICLKCLEKAPSRRYRTALDLAGDLRLWLEGRPIRAHRLSPLGHAWRWCRRHPGVAGLLAALALTLATGVIGLIVLLNLAETERTRLAEARRRAEAYEQFSASAADQLGLVLNTAINHQRLTTPDQMAAALLKLRDSIGNLRDRAVLPSTTLGILEAEIGWALVSYKMTDESRALAQQAIVDLRRSLAQDPEDSEARRHLAGALFLSGSLAEDAGQFDLALDRFEQLAAIHPACPENKRTFHVFTVLCINMQALARRLQAPHQAPLKERARRLSRQILGQLLGAHLDLAADVSAPELETLGPLLERYNAAMTPGDELIPIPGGDSREAIVSHWLAFFFASLAPFRSASSAANFDRDPEAGSRALIAAVQERCSRLGLEDGFVPATICLLFDVGFKEAAEARKGGRLDAARATAGRMMTIARRLVQEYPDSAYSHRVLSEAHNQVKKNAIQTGDSQAVEAALVPAIEAAQRALALNPDRVETRVHLEKLTEQLASIKAAKKAAAASSASP
jgi:tRNA A-37 threonylcarbamoyl transferase component Bud32/tetratricopeptide (TPR) repeat protein